MTKPEHAALYQRIAALRDHQSNLSEFPTAPDDDAPQNDAELHWYHHGQAVALARVMTILERL